MRKKGEVAIQQWRMAQPPIQDLPAGGDDSSHPTIAPFVTEQEAQVTREQLDAIVRRIDDHETEAQISFLRWLGLGPGKPRVALDPGHRSRFLAIEARAAEATKQIGELAERIRRLEQSLSDYWQKRS